MLHGLPGDASALWTRLDLCCCGGPQNGTPLGTLWPELSRERIRGIHSYVKRCKALQVGLQAIKAAGVEGVMVDVWWGIRGEGGPRHV